MKKKCIRILFTILCILTIFMSLVLPSGALSMDGYGAAVELSTVMTVNDQLSLYTPFVFSVFGTKGVNNTGSYTDLNNIYRFAFTHLMDPSDFRYSDGITVTFRANDGTAYIPVSFDVTNSDYTAPGIRNSGSQFITLSGTMESVQNYISSYFCTFQHHGYSLRTSNMTSSVNGVGSLRLRDPDVSRVRVKYDYSIFGIETLTRDVGSIIVDVPFSNYQGSVPLLPYQVLESFWGIEDCYIDYCDVTIEFLTSDFQSVQYTEDYQFFLLGGEVYDSWSASESLSNIFNNVDYQTGYENGYQAGFNVSQEESYLNGYNVGFSSGESVGYNKGLRDSWEDLSFTSWIGVAVSGVLDVPLFGNFTLGGILGVIVSMGLVLIVLKFFAGG